jgi:drug/metabolite transporter (DMT)-like permease
MRTSVAPAFAMAAARSRRSASRGGGSQQGGSGGEATRKRRDGRWLAYAALAAAISGIAWSAIFIRWSAIPGPSSAFYRVAIAGAILVPWWGITALASPRERSRIASTSRRAYLLALGGGIFFGLDLALYNTAVMRTTATTATLFGNNAPIFVGIGSWLFFRRRPARSFWIGLGCAMLGAAILLVATARGNNSGSDLTGAAMSLAAAAFFAAYLLTTEHVREEMDTLSFNAAAIVGSVATVLVVCLLLGSPLGGFTTRTWLALLGLGLISQLGAYLALTYALGHVPATIGSVSLLAQVPLTAILAVPLLGEPLTLPYLIGGGFVLAGIYIVTVGSR